MNGGYAMIDCTGVLLTSQETQTVPGIYEKTKSAYETGKPVYACNAGYYEPNDISPIQVMILPQGDPIDHYIATASILQVWVYDDDTVQVRNLIGG